MSLGQQSTEMTWCMFQAYGVHVNGFVRSPSRPENASEDSPSGLYMWIGRRSKTKQTFPGKLDHVAAGHSLTSIGSVLEMVSLAFLISSLYRQ